MLRNFLECYTLIITKICIIQFHKNMYIKQSYLMQDIIAVRGFQGLGVGM